MFKIYDNLNIAITRGDTARFNIKIYDINDREYNIKETDQVVLTVKKNIQDEEIIIQKNFINTEIILDSKDTKNLSFGNYVYDVQLTMQNGDVHTVIPPNIFRILEELNYE